MSYLCRNGHLVRHNYQAGLDCAKCKANEQRRTQAAEKRDIEKASSEIVGPAAIRAAQKG